MNAGRHRSIADGPARPADCPLFIDLVDEPGVCCYCGERVGEHSERSLSDRPIDTTPGPTGVEAYCPPT